MFRTLPEDSDSPEPVTDAMLEKLNPEKVLYQICIQTIDYIEFVRETHINCN